MEAVKLEEQKIAISTKRIIDVLSKCNIIVGVDQSGFDYDVKGVCLEAYFCHDNSYEEVEMMIDNVRIDLTDFQKELILETINEEKEKQTKKVQYQLEEEKRDVVEILQTQNFINTNFNRLY